MIIYFFDKYSLDPILRLQRGIVRQCFRGPTQIARSCRHRRHDSGLYCWVIQYTHVRLSLYVFVDFGIWQIGETPNAELRSLSSLFGQVIYRGLFSFSFTLDIYIIWTTSRVDSLSNDVRTHTHTHTHTYYNSFVRGYVIRSIGRLAACFPSRSSAGDGPLYDLRGFYHPPGLLGNDFLDYLQQTYLHHTSRGTENNA
jgi:hypothetical protein